MAPTETAPQLNITSILQLTTDEKTFNRILAGYARDKQEFTKSTPESLNEWILGIVLDWIEEVEKPVPVRTRSTGFGN
jgi:hypothetical protein